MAHLLTGRNVAIAGGIGGALLLFRQTRTAQKLDPVRSPLQTNAVENVNKRFTAAGGSEYGTPARASPLGSTEKAGSDAYHTNSIASVKNASAGEEKATQGGGPGGNDAATPVQPGKQGTEGRSGKEQHHGNVREVGAAQAG